MPTYFIIDGIKIDLYFDDHAPPHFHAIYAEYEELIEIQTLNLPGTFTDQTAQESHQMGRGKQGASNGNMGSKSFLRNHEKTTEGTTDHKNQ